MSTSTLLLLLQNAALLLAMVLAYETFGRAQVRRGLSGDIITGVVMGFIAVALMLTPFHFVSGIIFDSRSVLISLVGLFFGPIPTLVAMLVAALFRFFQGGVATWVGIGVIVVSGGAGLLWRQLRAESLSTVSWGELYGLGLAVHLLMLLMMLMLPQPTAFEVLRAISLPIMLIYPVATVALGMLMVNRLKQESTARTLAENEERLRLALSAANLGLADIDLRTGQFIVNDTYAEYLGLPPNSFAETLESAINRIHPRDRHRVFNAFRDYGTRKKAANVDELYQEFRVQVSLGKSIWVASLSKVVDWDEDGWPVRMLTTVNDITSRKDAEQTLEKANREARHLLNESTQARMSLLSALEDHQLAERALAESERALAEVSRIAKVGGWELDVRHQLQLTTQSYITLGMSPGTDLSLNDLLDSIQERDRDRVTSAFESARDKGASFDFEVQLARTNTESKWIRLIGHADAGEGGLPTVKGTMQDITARRWAEEKQKQSYDLLIKLAAQVPSMIYQFKLTPDGHMSFPWSNQAIEQIYEVDTATARQDAEWLFQRAHPDDLDKLQRDITASAQRLEPFHCEYRVLLPRQGLQWRLSEATPEKLQDGSILWHGITSDITERKEAEEAMRQASLVYQNSSEGMLVTEADSTIIDINKAFTDMTGYSREDIIGQKARVLQSEKNSKRFYQAMWSELNNTGHWEGELWNRRKNGESYLEWLVVNAVYDPDGQVHRWVAQFTDITEQKQNEKLIWQQANFDALTDLPNRRMFRDRLGQEIKKTHRSGLPLALLFIDLDHFKEINDTLGHETGDLLLKDAAARIDGCIRETDTVARLGGDEFIIILSELKGNTTLERVIRTILDSLSEPYKLGNEEVFITASMGVTMCPDDATDIDTLMKNADQAMYAAKHEGRNGYKFFTPHMQREAQERMRIISDLRTALVSNQLWVAYQPIIELATGRVHKAEALIRWRHPVEGHIGPDTFIPIAEETGLIHPISDFLFQEISQQAAMLRANCDPSFQVSINISPAQLQRRESSVYDILHSYMANQQLPGASLVLEITEGLLLDHRAAVTDQLIAFRDAGIEVALDDFGTGYSSLSYLKKFDIDYLKIDKSFIHNLTADSEDLVLCEAIIVMAHTLNIAVIAEGVETEEQRDLLLAAGCDYAQGYLYSRPVDSASLKVFLEQSQANAGATDS